jgi:hypothetical protein
MARSTAGRRDAARGQHVPKVAKQLEVSEATYHRWRPPEDATCGQRRQGQTSKLWTGGDGHQAAAGSAPSAWSIPLWPPHWP